MNRDRAKELLPIIQAFAGGEVIQRKKYEIKITQSIISSSGGGSCKFGHYSDWVDVQEGDFLFHDDKTEYRIKPKIKEYWLVECSDDWDQFFSSKEEAENWITKTGKFNLTYIISQLKPEEIKYCIIPQENRNI